MLEIEGGRVSSELLWIQGGDVISVVTLPFSDLISCIAQRVVNV